MTSRFIVRLLTAEGELLSWAEVYAEARPQGRPRSTPFMALVPTQFVIEQDGIASNLSIHWADLDVARLTALMQATPVKVAQVLRFDWIEPVWMVEGSKVDVPLPAVTVRAPVKVGVPVGGVGVRTY